jgi:hypothetical protein|tara:strand:+ start:798 stop:1505 length:708 start_codon:yes stop_codon:yes gene_type:complete
MPITVRKLSPKGINVFMMYLDEIRENERVDIPSKFLTDNKFSAKTTYKLSINKPYFESKFEMAKKLHYDIIFDSKKNVWSDVGMWSWLSAFLFDLTCPKKDDTRTPKMDYRHILSTNWNDFYRHLVASPVRLFDFHQENAAILLSSKIHEMGDMIEQFASTQRFVTNRTVISVLNNLYYDLSTKKMKRGAASYKKAGTHRRYKQFLDQISLTYDVQSMSDEELMDFLPSEFDAWL